MTLETRAVDDVSLSIDAVGLFSTFLAPSLRQGATTIHAGDLDALLLRPVASQFLVSARTIDPAEDTTDVIGCALSVLAGNATGIDWTALRQGEAYPVMIFKQPIRWVLTYVIPIGFIATFPAEALRGTLAPEILPSGLALAAIALVGTHNLSERGLRRYSSASS